VTILVDTNLLCRLCNPMKPSPSETIAARRSLQRLRHQGHQLAIVPQNLYEFWAVATRAKGTPPAGANGLGMSVERADLWLNYFLRTFHLLVDTEQSLVNWRMLVRTHRVTSFKSHDVRLVAAMQVHKVTHLLTFNSQDFNRFPNLGLLDPHTL
jgi:predicted nucleic acid-binding protein